MTLPEPPLIKKINRKIAQGIAFIAVGNANPYLTCAILSIKLIQIIHLKEGITKENIRDAWLAKSESTVKPYIINNWENIKTVWKNRDITFTGKKMFLSACYGNVALSQK